ncbi:uncharacterized protein BYT42DRAFT_257110 [Radiomyces spectabilis]|uniref:uncharacterized protein n=1 Tax=Radiomyces spectabilis TaxID=64574 RepID=UPI0022209726|nr:uncharacterized protein BYT42DRAFT_257110 [Radiomyces spectabilis]KAI8384325.1 hypothetical protein BYT42DRAFT_257110 [Radiomyces spectabilis]
MSLNRQRPRSRVANRAYTLSSLPPSTQSDITGYSSSHLHSIEELLQDWLTKGMPEPAHSPWFIDNICQCCQRPNCPQFDNVMAGIRKLENDVRLAAEIGQSLLHKHEAFVSESQEVKTVLEQQLETSNEKVHELQQLLEESDTQKHQLAGERDKVTWELQKMDKTLQDTLSDLEAANARCVHLGGELKAQNVELEKLRILKLMVRQADVREETLHAKLEDLQQELAISRKTELSLESKYKKLKAKHETMCAAYEKLRLEGDTHTTDRDNNLAWLRESNEKLRRDMLKLTTLPSSPITHSQQANQSHWITLIKELASANSKLKADLLDCKDHLSEARNEIFALSCKIDGTEEHTMVSKVEDEEDEDQEEEKEEGSLPSLPHKPPVELAPAGWLSTSAPSLRNMRKQLRTQPRRVTRDPTHATSAKPLPLSSVQPNTTATTVASSMPGPSGTAVIHHHYHYYMQRKKKSAKAYSIDAASLHNSGSSVHIDSKEKTLVHSDMDDIKEITERGTSEGNDVMSAFHQLQTYLTEVFRRLTATDIRALNRQLRKAFDILELTNMSNSIIDSILTEVESLHSKFQWVEIEVAQAKETSGLAGDGCLVAMEDFFPLLHTVQHMLKEIGSLRMTMNDLQLEYVKKIEENDQRVEQEVLQKRDALMQQQQQQHQQAQTTTAPATSPPSSAISWLTHFFQRSSTVQSLKHVSSQDDLGTRYINDLGNKSFTAVILDDSKRPIDLHSPSKAKSLRPKSDVDRYGPLLSFPTDDKRRHRSSAAQSIPFPMLRSSRSAGTIRRGEPSSVPALTIARRKRSTLGLNSELDLRGQPGSPDFNGEWSVNAFATSWLGTK